MANAYVDGSLGKYWEMKGVGSLVSENLQREISGVEYLHILEYPRIVRTINNS